MYQQGLLMERGRSHGLKGEGREEKKKQAINHSQSSLDNSDDRLAEISTRKTILISAQR